ncbi:hypothetical protein V8C42DRAFT_347909 [Trichoderma barbatum]
MSFLDIMKVRLYARKKTALLFSQAKNPEETHKNIIKKTPQESIHNTYHQEKNFEVSSPEIILTTPPQKAVFDTHPQEIMPHPTPLKIIFNTTVQETTYRDILLGILARKPSQEMTSEKPVQIYKGSPYGLECIPQRKYRQQENCFIVKLAEELILLIADYLTLYEKYMFSHSCHIIRWILSCDCKKELRRLNLSQRFVFLTDIAYDKPDRFVCIRCFKLHIVDIDDDPSRRKPPECIERSSSVSTGRHRLEHHHLQSALKFYQLDLNPPHLGKLLANYERTYMRGTTSYTHIARPRICGQHFVLLQRLKIENAVRRLTQRDLEQSLIIICPHVALIRSFWPILEDIVKGLCPLKVLDAVTTIALSVPGREVRGHCGHCHTDFAVLFFITERGITFTVWSNYGKYSSPTTPQWATRVWSNPHQWGYQVLLRALGDCRREYFSN